MGRRAEVSQLKNENGHQDSICNSEALSQYNENIDIDIDIDIEIDIDIYYIYILDVHCTCISTSTSVYLWIIPALLT